MSAACAAASSSNGQRRLRRAVEQLGEDDGRDAQSVGLRVEALSERSRPVPEDTDAEIGVEQVSQHQNGSRVWAGG
jgi:hypothetical protein